MPRRPRKVGVTIKTIFCDYKYNCYKGNKYWGLTLEELEVLVKLPCHYCGSTKKNNRNGFRYMGLDRKDNRWGYKLTNVVPCCKRCNSIKGEHLSYQEMLQVGKALRRYAKRG